MTVGSYAGEESVIPDVSDPAQLLERRRARLDRRRDPAFLQRARALDQCVAERGGDVRSLVGEIACLAWIAAEVEKPPPPR